MAVVTTVGTELVAEFGGASMPAGCNGGRGGGGPEKSKEKNKIKIRRPENQYMHGKSFVWTLKMWNVIGSPSVLISHPKRYSPTSSLTVCIVDYLQPTFFLTLH